MKRLASEKIVLALSLVALLAAISFADTIVYRNGRTQSGRLVEERPDEIVFEVEGGRITIPKSNIADYRKDGEGLRAPAPRSGALTPGGDARNEEERVSEKVAEDATPVECKAIAETKARLRRCLETTVGPSVEDRKKKYRDLLAADTESNEKLAVLFHKLNEHARARKTATITRRDNSPQIRRDAIDTLVGYGLKVIERLAQDGLSSEQGYTRWSASQAAAQIYAGGDRDDATALFGAYEVAARILPLLDETEWETSALMRSDGNKALEQITGQSVGWPTTDSKELSAEETEAKTRWRSIVAAQATEFRRREDAREKARKTLTELSTKLDDRETWREALAASPKAILEAERALGKR